MERQYEFAIKFQNKHYKINGDLGETRHSTFKEKNKKSKHFEK